MAKPEKLFDEVQLSQIRDFCVLGLAESVPEFINQDKAIDIICYWFPGDTLAIEALYRRIASKQAA